MVISPTQTACIALFPELSSNILTSQKLWTEGPPKVLTPVSTCKLGECIRNLVCQIGCATPCDGVLFPVYSDTGMFCNATCSYPEFSLNTCQMVCKNESCKMKTIELDDNNISCVSDISSLAGYPQTNGSTWKETATNLFQKVSECDYGGCIRSLIC